MNSIYVQNMNKKMKLSIFFIIIRKKSISNNTRSYFFFDTYFRKSDLYQKLFLDASKIINVPKSILRKKIKADHVSFISIQRKKNLLVDLNFFIYLLIT